MPELVGRARLPENAATVGVSEEAHELPWQLAPHRKPYPGYRIKRPRRKQKAGNAADHDPDRHPGREPGDNPGHEPGPGPDYGPESSSSSAIPCKHGRRTRSGTEIERSTQLFDYPGYDPEQDRGCGRGPDPGWLLDSLRAAGAQEQAAALLDRDSAARVPLDDPYAVGQLLDSLRAAGAEEQAAALLRRDPAAHVSLENPGAVADLLGRLREAGAQEQAARWLTARPPTSPSRARTPWPSC